MIDTTNTEYGGGNEVQHTHDEVGESVDHFTTRTNTPAKSGKVRQED